MKKIGEKFQKNINAPARPHQHVNRPIGSGSSSTVPNRTNRSPSQPKSPSKPNPRQSVAVALAAVGERLWESMAGLQWNLNARKKKGTFFPANFFLGDIIPNAVDAYQLHSSTRRRFPELVVRHLQPPRVRFGWGFQVWGWTMSAFGWTSYRPIWGYMLLRLGAFLSFWNFSLIFFTGNGKILSQMSYRQLYKFCGVYRQCRVFAMSPNQLQDLWPVWREL